MADRKPETEFTLQAKEVAEILPPNIGELSASEASPLVDRAASRVNILKPQNEFWEGVAENLKGAAGYIEANKKKIGSKTFRIVAGTSLVANMLAACASPEAVTAVPTEIISPTAVPTEVVSIPQLEPSEISALNVAAQEAVNSSFEGWGIQDPELIGSGLLEDADGNSYALFGSTVKDKKTGEVLSFLLIGNLGEDNSISEIRGLVLQNENEQGPEFTFLAVGSESVEGPYVRTNTDTGKLEIFRNRNWEELNAPDNTFDKVYASLGGGVLAAPRLADLTPTPEPTVTQEVVKREMGIFSWNQEVTNSITPDMLEPLPEEKVTRLIDSYGNPVPFGVLVEDRQESDSGLRVDFFSGIVRGWIPGKGEWGGSMNGTLVFEIPLESGDSEYLLVYFPDPGDQYIYQSLWVFENGEVPNRLHGAKHVGYSFPLFNKMLSNNDSVGAQIIIGAITNEVTLATNPDEIKSAEVYSQQMRSLVDSILKGEVVNNNISRLTAGQTFLPSAIVK